VGSIHPIKTSEVAKAKGEKFSELTKKKVYHHHLGATGYATKKKI
jgi:hypothetical protein